ncbi:MAG TPA: alanine dehydrogenase, partial [Clostridia bacterium]|nr:alanine dehydrogenase [Clostridia bacterium]
MIFGLARDYKAGENRTIATPREIASIVNAGFTAIVQKGAGERAGFPDARYEQAGARMVDSLAEVYAGADFVVKVKE